MRYRIYNGITLGDMATTPPRQPKGKKKGYCFLCQRPHAMDDCGLTEGERRVAADARLAKPTT